jgi:hypothetical protein
MDLAEGIVLHRQRPHHLLDLGEPLHIGATSASVKAETRTERKRATTALV